MTTSELNHSMTDVYLKMNLQFFAKDGPGGEKTEPATSKKLKDAREEGKVAKSKELNSAFELVGLFLIMKFLTGFMSSNFYSCFIDVYKKMVDIVNDSAGGMRIQTAQGIINYALTKILWVLWPVLLVAVTITVVVSIFQVGWKPTLKPMKPKFSKLNPLSGFKKIFSKDSLFELVKSIVKLVVIFVIAYSNIKDYSDELFVLYEITLNQAIALIGDIILDTGLKISFFYLFVGFADYLFSKHRFNEEMKMTKQEVKDEYKNSEGDPQIKGKQRQRMREASQRRMMQDIPKADVVITNPTHISVALRYDTNIASSPVVVAKGEDYLALKIREIAKENNVEIIENKPLARMLYANVDIGQEIPPELYQAVAEVLALVYKHKNM